MPSRATTAHRRALATDGLAPPPGCAWVQVGGEFVLTAIATGVVVDVVHHLLG